MLSVKKTFFACILTLVMFLSSISVYAGGLPEGVVDNTPMQPFNDLQSSSADAQLTSASFNLTLNSVYNLRPANSSTAYLNVYAGTDANGTKVCMWAKDGSTEQKFKLISGSTSGTFKLVAMCSTSGRVLDAYSPSRPIVSGAQADIWTANDPQAQILYVIPNSDGTYAIKLAAYSTLALTAVSTSNNGSVQFRTFSTSNNNQKWIFTPVTTTVKVTGVSLNASSASINVGATKSLTATISPSNATNKSVTWTSSNTSVATVSSSGVVTGKAAGTATITVKTADGGYTATCKVTVANPTVKVTGISVSPTSASINVGATKSLTATISPSNATNKSVTWTSSSTSVATVSSTGVVTGKAAGTANITAKTSDGGYTAICKVTVTNNSNPYAALNLTYPVPSQYVDLPQYFKSYPYDNGTMHQGIDISAPQGTPIYAVASGTVQLAGGVINNQEDVGTVAHNSMGWFATIKHNKDNPNGTGKLTARYLHFMQAPPSTVRAGKNVTDGQTIGYMGSTGASLGNEPIPHLHIDFNFIDALWGGVGNSNANDTTCIDPVLFWSSKAFRFGTVYNSTAKLSIMAQSKTDVFLSNAINQGRYIDASIIDYIGESEFNEWLKTKSTANISTLVADFNISQSELRTIINVNNLKSVYNEYTIMQKVQQYNASK